jgi:hypothetical protein
MAPRGEYFNGIALLAKDDIADLRRDAEKCGDMDQVLGRSGIHMQ